MGIGILIAIATGSLAAAGLCLLLLLLLRGREPAPLPQRAADEPVAILFEAGEIVDASPPARSLLKESGNAGDDWAALTALLGRRFPDLPATPEAAAARAPLSLPGEGGQLCIERAGADALRLSIEEHDPDPEELHRMALARLESRTMRAAADLSPHPCWQIDDSGRVLWANEAYLALARETLTWAEGAALPRLFELPEAPDATARRVSLALPDGSSLRWFDVSARALGATRIGHATNVDAVVHGEAAQRTFVQTLTKIFAQLSVGLAVFDRDRNLALFNPALLDLTGLAAESLSAQPTLLGFFDMLREAQVMPEPRDYAAWRARMAELARPGSEATYSDSWSLPSGLVYRVTGRPQPDGAVAVLIEDVTSEVSLTRRFRTDLELGQAVLDSLDMPLAVFSAQGILVLCNAPYRRLWGVDPDTSLRETTRCDAIDQWQRDSLPGTDWEGLRAALAGRGAAAHWQGRILRRGDAPLDLRALPLPGGATLALFGPTRDRPPAHPAAGHKALPRPAATVG